MAVDLVWFWEFRGYQLEARDRLTAVLASAPADDPGRGRALVAAAQFANLIGEPAQARTLLLEGLPIVRRQGDERWTMLAASGLAVVAASLGDEDEMARRAEQAIATARAGSDDWSLAVALNRYASTPNLVRRDPQRARRMVEEALCIIRRLGAAGTIAATAHTAAEIALDAGDLDAADQLLSESLDHAQEVDDRSCIAYTLASRAVLSLLRDDVEGAAAALSAAIQTFAPYFHRVFVAAAVLPAAGTIAAMQREPRRAAMLWAAGDSLRGGIPEREAIAGLRARWQPHARADVDDQAAWDAAALAGTELALEAALALAAGREHDPQTREHDHTLTT